MLTEEYDSTYDVDIDELVDSMREDLPRRIAVNMCRDNGNKCGLICKIVYRIRQTDRNAYEPSVLSIGPYHHSELLLHAMETEKWICVDYILKLNRDVSLREYLSLISGLEKQARGCYGEDINMDSKEFLQMLLLDSCFILVYLGGMHRLCRAQEAQGPSFDGHGTQEDNGTAEWYNSSAVYDLLLLENQIPLFIVRTIYRLFSRDTRATTPLLTSDISQFMEGILYHFPKAITEANRPGDFYHLLHLCLMYLKPGHKLEDEQCHGHAGKHRCFDFISDICQKIFCFEQEENLFHELNELNSLMQVNRWRRAVDYHEAGIHFKKREFDEDPHSLLDIRFRKGVMEIPCSPVDDKSSLLFRNLEALEQTCPEVGDDITAYIVLMSQLISTVYDVVLLAQKGIIVHQMESDEEVSTLFTKIFEYVVFDFRGEHYLKSLCCAMEAHYQSRVNRRMAWLWHNHFTNP